jgi:hypothetical protein
VKLSKAKDISEVRFNKLLDLPLLSKYSPFLLQIRFKALEKRYTKKHGEPRKFKTLIKSLIFEAEQMDDKPRKRKKRRSPEEIAAAQIDSSKIKSAEFVSTSDEEGDEEA